MDTWSSDSDSDDDLLLLYMIYRRLKRKRALQKRYVSKQIPHKKHKETISKAEVCKKVPSQYCLTSYTLLTQKVIRSQEMELPDVKFLKLYKMTKEQFKELFSIVSPHIHHQDTAMKECIPADERILICLRYFATGSTGTYLAKYFKRGSSTISCVWAQTVRVIYIAMKQDFMPKPDKGYWKNSADCFSSIWRLPNCIGTLVSKTYKVNLVHRQQNGEAGPSYIEVALCCDAVGLISMFEVADELQDTNETPNLINSKLRDWLNDNDFDIPLPTSLPEGDGSTFPHYFVANETFPLHPNILKLFAKKHPDPDKQTYNSRLNPALGRANKTFTLMEKRFKVLNSIRRGSIDKIVEVVQAVCVLHNFLNWKKKYSLLKTDGEDSSEVQSQGPRLAPSYLRANLVAYFLSNPVDTSLLPNLISDDPHPNEEWKEDSQSPDSPAIDIVDVKLETIDQSQDSLSLQCDESNLVDSQAIVDVMNETMEEAVGSTTAHFLPQPYEGDNCVNLQPKVILERMDQSEFLRLTSSSQSIDAMHV